jgi:hypothetical protein
MEANWKRIWCLLAMAGPKTTHMHTYFWLGLASASPFPCHVTVWWRTSCPFKTKNSLVKDRRTWHGEVRHVDVDPDVHRRRIGGVHLVVILSLFQIMIGNLVYRIMVMLMAAKPKPGIGSGSEVDCRCSTHFTIDRALGIQLLKENTLARHRRRRGW